MSINDNIHNLRLQRNLSQEKFGELLGVSGQAVSKWEQNITSPDISLLPIIAEYFGVTIDSLFQNTPKRRYSGYGDERYELLARYESANGTDLDFEKAETALAKVILNGQAVTQDYIAYGILHRARAEKDRELALRYFRRAITEGNSTRDLQWLAAHQALTNLLVDMGRTNEAIEEQRKWCDSEPDCAWAHVAYAYALQKANRLEQACIEIEKAQAIHAEDVGVQAMAGDILAKAGRYEEAFLCWDKAYELDPSDIACLFSKAETLAGIGETEQAIAEFENILRWLEKHEYNLDIEGVYPRRRIEELRHSR